MKRWIIGSLAATALLVSWEVKGLDREGAQAHQIRAPTSNAPSQRLSAGALSRQFGSYSPTAGKSLCACGWVVADAVEVEPVSTAKFPANREKNREFRQIRPLCEISKANMRAISKAFSQIPYATEQGIISAEQGILAREQGILPAKTEIIAE